MNSIKSTVSLVAAVSLMGMGMFAQPATVSASSTVSTKVIHCSIKFLGQYNATTDKMNGIYKRDCSVNGKSVCPIKILGQKSPTSFNGIIKESSCDYSLKDFANDKGWVCDSKVLGQGTLTTFNGIYKNDCRLTIVTSQPTPTPTATPTPRITPTPTPEDNTPTPTPTPAVEDNTPTPTPEQHNHHKPTPTPTKVHQVQQPTGGSQNPTPTPTPDVLGEVTQLPSTGPGAAMMVALGGISAALIGKKFIS